MSYLFLSIVILGGLVAMGYLLRAVAKDLREMAQDDEVDDIGGGRKLTDAEMIQEIERWRDGK